VRHGGLVYPWNVVRKVESQLREADGGHNRDVRSVVGNRRSIVHHQDVACQVESQPKELEADGGRNSYIRSVTPLATSCHHRVSSKLNFCQLLKV